MQISFEDLCVFNIFYNPEKKFLPIYKYVQYSKPTYTR